MERLVEPTDVRRWHGDMHLYAMLAKGRTGAPAAFYTHAAGQYEQLVRCAEGPRQCHGYELTMRMALAFENCVQSRRLLERWEGTPCFLNPRGNPRSLADQRDADIEAHADAIRADFNWDDD